LPAVSVALGNTKQSAEAKTSATTLAWQGAGEDRVRKQLAERRQQRPVTSDDDSMLDAKPVAMATH
jgi:hypothetical protein